MLLMYKIMFEVSRNNCFFRLTLRAKSIEKNFKSTIKEDQSFWEIKNLFPRSKHLKVSALRGFQLLLMKLEESMKNRWLIQLDSRDFQDARWKFSPQHGELICGIKVQLLFSVGTEAEKMTCPRIKNLASNSYFMRIVCWVIRAILVSFACCIIQVTSLTQLLSAATPQSEKEKEKHLASRDNIIQTTQPTT